MSVPRTNLRAVRRAWCLVASLSLAAIGCSSSTSSAPPKAPAAPSPSPAAGGDVWDVPAEARSVQNPVPSSPQALNRGESLFHRHCGPCHGPRGRGDGPVSGYWKELPKDLGEPARQDRLSDGEIFWKVSKGHRQGAEVIMPAFSERIPSAEDRWKIVLFVRTLRAESAIKN
jgi:mono/diheme cytochrome c family protein